MRFSLARRVKNAAQLSPCHNQISPFRCVFVCLAAGDFDREFRNLCSCFVLSTCYVRFMSRASSHALKRPPVTAPSEPAGATPFPELAVAIESKRRRGRGAQSNESGRFEAEARVAFDDGWQSLDELPPFKTTVSLDTSRKVITRNDSPDIGFDRSINPYRGGEHGCVYCFARPTHAYLGLSPGLDFETRLLAKPEAPALLEKELAASGYEPRMIAIGTNTDPYQPIEREHK